MIANKFIPLMVPDIQEQDLNAVVEVLKSGMLIQGKKVEELENNLARFLNVKHAIAVSNGTVSLQLALSVLKIGEGDEVIVPAFSYIATANVIELVGARPVFVDIDSTTSNINVALVESAITAKTKAIMPVHEFGLACDITELVALAQKHNLYIIEDAACALGATENGKFAGTFGTIGSFSFHPRKAITSGEGGMLVTNDDTLADKMRQLRNHGISMSSGKTEYVEAGYNFRLTDFQAALVNSQLQRLPVILNYKHQLSEIYFDGLAGLKYVQLPVVKSNKKHTWQSFHILIDDAFNRDELIDNMKTNGVGVNLGAQCMPAQVYFQNKYGLNCEMLCPNALKSYQHGLVLPLYERMDADDVKTVIQKLKNLLA